MSDSYSDGSGVRLMSRTKHRVRRSRGEILNLDGLGGVVRLWVLPDFVLDL